MLAKGSILCRYVFECKLSSRAMYVRGGRSFRMLSAAIDRAANIVVVGPRSGDDCLDELVHLPHGAKVVAQGNSLQDMIKAGEIGQLENANVLLNVSGNAHTLGEIIEAVPSLKWIHSTTAGLDHLLCPQIVGNEEIVLTNARGVFSSSLAEYVVGVMMHFAKQVPRLMKQQQESRWEKFCVTELRGKTLGIVGYGSIGQACARVAKPFGMRVVALRKHPAYSSARDSNVDEVVGMDKLDYVMEQSDFVVVVLPLTPETRHFVRAEHFAKARRGQVLINIGRGALIDEEALCDALEKAAKEQAETGSTTGLAGAALDVFTVEPLPQESRLWALPNVLVSPHNADLLVDSRQKSVRFFTENCKHFLAGEDLECIVDKTAGY